MKDFYTSVGVHGSKILFRGIKNGKKVNEKLNYNPKLYTISRTGSTPYKTITGESLQELPPKSLYEAKKFIKDNKDIAGFKIFGNQRFEYAYIADKYQTNIEWDLSLITIFNIDIEVGSENGFPDPETAVEPITAITIKKGGKYFVFGCGDFNNSHDDVRYIKCKNEIELIQYFLDFWTSDYPDIVTGWNIKFFDINYIINRIINIFGEEKAKEISPWGNYYERTAFVAGKSQKNYVISGVAVLDYLELYKKFAPRGKSQESYRLDAIANVEIGEKKLTYDEYGNLHTLYRDNYQKFIEYNIHDVGLVDRLDGKLKLIELALTLAYDSKCNYEDVFTQVRMWDAIIYNHLLKRNIIIPPNEEHVKKSAYVGAYVKDPKVGMHKWIASFDLDSLYPHLIMQYNISPEMFIEPTNWPKNITPINDIDDMLEKKRDLSFLKLYDITATPNGQFFSRKKQGFLAEIMETMYTDRKVYKKKMLESKKELQSVTNESERKRIENQIARYDNLQLAKKVSLNSAYGALGNEFFRFFDVRQASAVTTAGQLSIRWIEKKMNDFMNTLLKTNNVDYVIASDTDSIYLSMDKLIQETILKTNPNAETNEIIDFMDKVCNKKLQDFINKSYQELAEYTNAFQQKMHMKREVLADKGIWTAKKRYIVNVHDDEGVRLSKPKIKVMGLEMVKSSTPAACRTKLRESLDVILNQDENSIIKFIDKFRKEFRTLNVADIAFPRTVNGIGKYHDDIKIYGLKTPIHVRGALIYNNLIRTMDLNKKYELIKEGEKIKFIYIKEPNKHHTDIITFHNVIPEEFGLNDYIDYKTQFNKSFLEPLKIILDCIGWKTEKVNTLESFFKKT